MPEKLWVGGGGPLHYSVTPVQTESQSWELGVWSLELGVRSWSVLRLDFCLTIFASYLGFESGVMRGFQKGITLGGRTSVRVNLVSLQKWVAKKFAKFLHLIGDLSQGS